MKKLMTLALVALLSFGVASVSWAQEGAAGGEMKAGKAEKTPHHKKSKKKKHKKATQEAPAAETK